MTPPSDVDPSWALISLLRSRPGDRPGIEALLRSNEWDVKDLDEGEAWVALAEDRVIGLVRVVEVGSKLFVIDDVLVREDRRGHGIGADLMRTAMAERDGEFYLVCHDERIPFYTRLGFERIEETDYPKPALDYGYRIGDLPDRPDHQHRLMRRATSRA